MVGAGELAEGDAGAILDWCDAYDGEKATATPNGDGEYVGDDRWGNSRAPTTLRQWLISASMYAREVEGSVLDATAGQFNDVSQAMKGIGRIRGSVPVNAAVARLCVPSRLC